MRMPTAYRRSVAAVSARAGPRRWLSAEGRSGRCYLQIVTVGVTRGGRAKLAFRTAVTQMDTV